MLLAVPLVDGLFKCRDFPKIVRHLVSSGDVSVSSTARAARISRKTAWSVLKTLRRTGHLDNGKIKRMDKDFIVVNLRDVATDALFRFSGTRRFLYLKLKGDVSLSEAASSLSMKYVTVKKLAAKLRKAGVLTEENRVRDELVRRPEDPLDLIPRKEHRQAVRFFLDELKSEVPQCMYGGASWGVEVLEINVLALQKSPSYSSAILTQDLVDAASAANLRFGFKFNLAVATFLAWFENAFAQVPSLTLLEASDGIFVRGFPPCPEDYFECVEEGADEERIKELLAKGYIRKTERGFAYTDKALNAFKTAPSAIKETIADVDGVGVRIISASTRTSLIKS